VQTALSFPQSQEYREEDFIFLDENSEAEKILTKFFAQNKFDGASLPSLILKGEKSCGKTHLLNIFAKKNAAKILTRDEISRIDLVKFFAKDTFYIFDDADEIGDDEILLRLLNSAFESGAFLIISLKNSANFKLWDLVSRLKNIFVAEIKGLQESSIKQLVASGLSRRQIKLSGVMIDFIATNVARDYSAVFEVLNQVEDLCHKQKGELLLRDLKVLFSSSE
jgi:chromosomal replication initiation ATPase DnaA